jgi:hypothetical protein
VLRTNETIDTDRVIAGRTYSAEVARPIVDSRGATTVPVGSRAELIVVSATEGGTVGTAELELAVRSITVNDRKYPVISEITEQEARREGVGANRRTAEMVGGGALLGTLIGAIAGGGTGAAIGAAAGAAGGAAGGAAVQVLTEGNRVRVLLTFRLERHIRLQGYRT